MAVRVAQLEAKVVEKDKQIQPLLDLYNAGKVLGRMLFFIGGFIMGLVALWKAIGDWVMSHIK